MNLMLHILFLVLLLHESYGVIYYLNESEFERMPPMYRLDSYESCLQRPSDVYCSLSFQLVSDEPNELLHMIEEYSEFLQTHFDHTKLRYGICVTQNCQNYIQNETNISQTILEECLNQSFWEKYQLKTRIQYYSCYSSSDNKVNIDTGDRIAGIVVFAIIMLNVVGTLYDVYCTNEREDKHMILSFSIKRNWKQLMSTKRSLDTRLQRLECLNGMKCFMVGGVILVHSIFPYLAVGENIHELELSYSKVPLQLVLNSSLMMQAYFIISGFLLAYKMRLISEKKQLDWNMIPNSIFNRYLRLTPSYAFVILMLATWLKFVGPGPLWATTAKAMMSQCKQRWWMNLLYFNNYVHNFQCLAPSWSLAVDMQLFLVGIVLCVLLSNTKLKKTILISLCLVGIIATAVHTYFRDLNAILAFAPSAATVIFADDPVFNETYRMGHANASSYFIGISLGYFVFKWQQKGIDNRKYSILRFVYWTVLPLIVAVVFSGSFFSRYAPRDPLYIRVLYAALSKPVIGILTAILIAGMIFKIENIYRKYFEWDLWTIPSRLTYGVYLVHLPYIIIYINMQSSLIQFSAFNMIVFSILVTIVSYLTAIPMFLLIEAPFTELSKYITARPKKEERKEALKNNKHHSKIE